MHRLLSVAGLRAQRGSEFWALQNINLEVRKGEAVALLGPNGSGKSTLLQIISGILQPTTGRVLRDGRVAALLELGAGFNPDFTGRENVYLNGEIMGFSAREVDQAFPSIAAFAEIGKFMDRPVKEYSTGMYVRLAFSSAIHVEPDVLIVDEALSVGDAIFASRCIQKFEELRRKGVTVLLVSHDLGLIKRLADRAVFMLDGKIVLEGTPNDAVNRYVGYVLEREQPESQTGMTPPGSSSFRHGDGTSRITGIEVLNSDGKTSQTFFRGDPMVVRVRAAFERAADGAVVGILIRNRIGMDVFGTNTRIEGYDLGAFERGDVLEVDFHLECVFTRQDYTLTVATQHADGTSQDWLDDAVSFSVVDTKEVAGVLSVHTTVEFRKLAAEQVLERRATEQT